VSRRPRVAVVGHVEWATHALGAFPGPGEIRPLEDAFDEPAGGGAVAAIQAANLGAETYFFTALGADSAADAAHMVLAGHGITVRAAPRAEPQTRAISVTGPTGDRAIALIGMPLAPRVDDQLGWEDLADMDAIYFTGRDPATLTACRTAPALVVTARRWRVLADAGIECDVLVSSASDPDEQIPPGELEVPPGAWAITDGARGGTWFEQHERPHTWSPVRPPGPAADSYGCGDTFAAGLTVGLAAGYPLADAIALGARCGAHTLTARGGLRGQLVEQIAPPDED
jgi:ribokinase